MYKSAYKTSSVVYVTLCDCFMSYKSMRVCINAHNRDVFTIILNASRCYHVCFGVITQQSSGEKESKACHFVLFDSALFILLIWSCKMLFFLSVVGFFSFFFFFCRWETARVWPSDYVCTCFGVLVCVRVFMSVLSCLVWINRMLQPLMGHFEKTLLTDSSHNPLVDST